MKCPDCKGSGKERVEFTKLTFGDVGPDVSEETCKHCDGKGAVPAEVDPWPDNEPMEGMK